MSPFVQTGAEHYLDLFLSPVQKAKDHREINQLFIDTNRLNYSYVLRNP